MTSVLSKTQLCKFPFIVVSSFRKNQNQKHRHFYNIVQLLCFIWNNVCTCGLKARMPNKEKRKPLHWHCLSVILSVQHKLYFYSMFMSMLMNN